MSLKFVTLCALLALALSHAHPHPHPRSAPAKEHTHVEESGLAETAALIQKRADGALSDLTCDTCQLIADYFYEASQNNGTATSLLKELDSLCQTAFPTNPSSCETVATTLVDLLPKIAGGFIKLGYNSTRIFCSMLGVCQVPCCLTQSQPEQVHLALAGDVSRMAVSWTTLNQTATSTVRYGLSASDLSMVQSGSQWTYTKGGWIGVLHKAVMTGLSPATTYFYQVGDAQSGFSEVFSFRTFANQANETIRIACIGDMGADWTSDRTVQSLINDLNAGQFDMVIHNGDISYADGNEMNWDIFLRKLQPVASRVPYMTCPGNHELWWNFTAYKARWAPVMPWQESGVVDADSMYYSFNLGGGNYHFLSGNTETWLDTAEIDQAQVNYIKQDLAAAAAARWKVVFTHRPFYCADKEKAQCDVFTVVLQSELEDVMATNKVDLVLTAHMHNYQRTFPLYKGIPLSSNYNNPPAPTYLVNGAAGNREGNGDNFNSPSWLAFKTADYGYGILTVSPSSLTWEFINDQGRTVVDSIAITKN